MAELRVRRQEDLEGCEQPFNDSDNYQKAVRFGGEELVRALSGYIDHINERNDTGIYNNAVSAMESASSESSYKAAAATFKTIPGFKDADSLAEQCLERAEVCRKDSVYVSARSQMTGNDVSGYEAAIKTFSTILGWNDAEEQIYACHRKIEEIKEKEEADRLERKRKAKIAAKKRKRIIAIVTPIVVACIVFVIVLVTVIIPQQKLNKAMALIDSGDYKAAFLLLDGLDNKNSKELQESIKPQYQKVLLSEAEIGSYVVFGSYEQDNNTSNGKEDIEWIVLDREGDSILVISRYALDCQQYNASLSSVTWETCSLRKWLNGTFLNSAFSESASAMIPSVMVSADNNPSKSSTDQVFLLNITEAKKYFGSDSVRQCQGTAYCDAQGANKVADGKSAWWLRSWPGYNSKYAAIVGLDGSVLDNGGYVLVDDIAVRPALWINIGS